MVQIKPSKPLLLPAAFQLLGWESYAFDKRRRLDKRGHLQALVMQVNGKIKRTVSDVPSCDQAIFNPQNEILYRCSSLSSRSKAVEGTIVLPVEVDRNEATFCGRTRD